MTRLGLFLGVEPGAGGMFQYTLAVLRAMATLPRDRFEVRAAYVHPLWDEYLTEHAVRGVRIEAGRTGLRLATLLMALRLPGPTCRRISRVASPLARGLLREDCVLWIFPAQDVVTYQMPVRAVGTIHDLMHRYEQSFREAASPARYALREQRFKGIVEWAEAILVDSETGRRHVVESYGADPEHVLPLPYIAPPAEAATLEATELRARYHLPPQFLFYPAQFWEHKNHARLLEALARLRADGSDARLVLAGARSSGYAAVSQRARELGLGDAVTFAGFVPQEHMRSFYACARGLVMPTFFGPTNIPPLEAFAAGCPVAVSNVYAMSEQVGDAALLFDPRSVDEIAAAMRRLWEDGALREELRRKGFVRAGAWGPVQFGEALLDHLELILARAIGPPGRRGTNK